MPEPESPRVPALGFDPADAKKALPQNNMISDRLLARYFTVWAHIDCAALKLSVRKHESSPLVNLQRGSVWPNSSIVIP